MSQYVTILSIPYPQQVYIIKGRLESEGIECFVKDELTVQTNPVWSYAVGGVKLQVKEEDVEAATKILEAEGYLNNQNAEVNPYKKLESFADKLPFFKKVRFEVRLVAYIVMVITVVYLLIYFITLPSTYKRLSTPFCWCVDYITYKDSVYMPMSYGVHLSFRGGCNENIDFKAPGKISLPGFKTFPVKANWSLINDSIIISRADTFQFVYNGRYGLDFSGSNLVLTSKTTTINCTYFALF
jgi:putative signal transducing protein